MVILAVDVRPVLALLAVSTIVYAFVFLPVLSVSVKDSVRGAAYMVTQDRQGAAERWLMAVSSNPFASLH